MTPRAPAPRSLPRTAPAPFTRLGKTLMRALSRDPFDGAIAIDLEVALRRETRRRRSGAAQRPPSPAPPLIALTTRPQVTIAWLQEIVMNPSLLRAFAQETADRQDATLVVLAPPAAELQKLIEIVEADPALSGESCDITVLAEPSTTPARLLLASRASARLTAGRSPAPYDLLPAHGAVTRAQARAGFPRSLTRRTCARAQFALRLRWPPGQPEAACAGTLPSLRL